MMPFDKPLEAIAGPDVERLVDEREIESQHLDYKAKSYVATTNGHRDFLKDVTAMANAYGGYLILGIREDDANLGTPVTIEPVPDAASEKERLSRVALASIDPHIAGLDMRVIGTSAGEVIVVRVPRSGRAPHMVLLGAFNFWRRHGTNNNAMSVDEIGDAFLITGRRVEQGLELISRHQQTSSLAAGSFTSLCLGTLPLLHYPRPIDVTEPWANELLASPPRPTGEIGSLDRGIRPTTEAQYDEIVPALDGLVRRRRDAEHRFRFALGRNGLLSLRTSRILAGGLADPQEIHPKLLISLAVHFFRLSQALATHLGFEGELASYLSLENLLQPSPTALRPYVPRGEHEWHDRGEGVFVISEHNSVQTEPLIWDSAAESDGVARRLLDMVFNAFHFKAAPLFRDGRYDAQATSPPPD